MRMEKQDQTVDCDEETEIGDNDRIPQHFRLFKFISVPDFIIVELIRNRREALQMVDVSNCSKQLDILLNHVSKLLNIKQILSCDLDWMILSGDNQFWSICPAAAHIFVNLEVAISRIEKMIGNLVKRLSILKEQLDHTSEVNASLAQELEQVNKKVASEKLAISRIEATVSSRLASLIDGEGDLDSFPSGEKFNSMEDFCVEVLLTTGDGVLSSFLPDCGNGSRNSTSEVGKSDQSQNKKRSSVSGNLWMDSSQSTSPEGSFEQPKKRTFETVSNKQLKGTLEGSFQRKSTLECFSTQLASSEGGFDRNKARSDEKSTLKISSRHQLDKRKLTPSVGGFKGKGAGSDGKNMLERFDPHPSCEQKLAVEEGSGPTKAWSGSIKTGKGNPIGSRQALESSTPQIHLNASFPSYQGVRRSHSLPSHTEQNVMLGKQLSSKHGIRRTHSFWTTHGDTSESTSSSAEEIKSQVNLELLAHDRQKSSTFPTTQTTRKLSGSQNEVLQTRPVTLEKDFGSTGNSSDSLEETLTQNSLELGEDCSNTPNQPSKEEVPFRSKRLRSQDHSDMHKKDVDPARLDGYQITAGGSGSVECQTNASKRLKSDGREGSCAILSEQSLADIEHKAPNPSGVSPATSSSQSSISPLLVVSSTSSAKDHALPKTASRATKVQEMISSGAFLQTTALMTLAGGALGPWLDGQHGAFGVLNYHQPFNIIAGEMTILKTALWVPPLFGVAGFLIGGLYPLLDYIFSTDNQKMKPSMPKVLYGISFFAAQYYLSGLLTFAGADLLDIHIILAILAAIGFMAFDFSLAGFLISFLTAIGGPLIEIALINQFGLYDYTHADFYGIDSWIPWVYFMGGPAVGNLSRIVFQNRVAALHSKSK